MCHLYHIKHLKLSYKKRGLFWAMTQMKMHFVVKEEGTKVNELL